MNVRKLTAGVATVLVVLLANAGGVSSSQGATECTANPGKVTKQADGTGIRAGNVTVVCTGDWYAHESVMWSDASGDWLSGKWTYGGNRDVYGTGSMTIGPFARDYRHNAWWKLRVVLNGKTFDGPITKFRSY